MHNCIIDRKYIKIPIALLGKTHVRSYTIAKAKYSLSLAKESQDSAPSKHPGIVTSNCVYLPNVLIEAANVILETYPGRAVYEEATKLNNYLSCRKPPFEIYEFEEKKRIAINNLISAGKLPSLENDLELPLDSLSEKETKILNLNLKSTVYNWNPIKYTAYLGVAYLIARFSGEYASLIHIFEEIKKRDQTFKPLSFFDFGSGVGSGFWALSAVWPGVAEEAYLVDSSVDMNILAERLMKGGSIENESVLRPKKSLFFRQFLPASSTLTYDVVLSSHSFFEVGKLKERAQTVDILWKKVAPNGFLVLVENHSLAGYKILMELRDFLLEMNAKKRERNAQVQPIHVFSPCPHDLFCPRYFHPSRRSCHFEAKYHSSYQNEVKTERYSYVVFRKAERKAPSSYWPRLVQSVQRRHGHVIIHACTPEAELESLVVTKAKHGTKCYQVCKKSDWGDLLPAQFVPLTGEDSADVPEHTVEDSADVPEHTVEDSADVPEHTVEDSADVPEHTVEDSADVPEHTVEDSADVPEHTVEDSADVPEHTVEDMGNVIDRPISSFSSETGERPNEPISSIDHKNDCTY